MVPSSGDALWEHSDTIHSGVTSQAYNEDSPSQWTDNSPSLQTVEALAWSHGERPDEDSYLIV